LGPDVELVESGEVLSEQLEYLFQLKTIEKAPKGTRQIRVCITDLTDHFERLAVKLMDPEPIGDLEKVVL
jgi:hypothetical protein